MLHLDLEDVQAGMVIGQDVLGIKGQLLLSAGAALTDKHLEVLRAHNVRRIVIRPIESETSASAAAATAADTRLETKFRLCDEQHPLIHELRRLCRSRLAERQGDSE